jgi:hypothetical protein
MKCLSIIDRDELKNTYISYFHATGYKCSYHDAVSFYIFLFGVIYIGQQVKK